MATPFSFTNTTCILNISHASQEEREGPPKEIFKSSEPDINRPLIETGNGDDFDDKALRQYQLDRLKYYYAVIECSTVAASKAIYDACDGLEFEKSANMFDLRYIPEDMEFEDEPMYVLQFVYMYLFLLDSRHKVCICDSLQMSSSALIYYSDQAREPPATYTPSEFTTAVRCHKFPVSS
jgi:hypothetical protein